jgi:hypothetical protein
MYFQRILDRKEGQYKVFLVRKERKVSFDSSPERLLGLLTEHLLTENSVDRTPFGRTPFDGKAI